MMYRGRFAPSPTGPLHAGSLVAALASWLDARLHGGSWVVRIEDADAPRCLDGMAEHILHQLAVCGLVSDEPPWWQSQRGAAYAQALVALRESELAYPCGCTRRDIDEALSAQGSSHQRDAERVYPGTCRSGLMGKQERATRFNTDDPAVMACVDWVDRRLGRQQQDVSREVGDFVLRRADGLWAYQLAVVVDDAAQGITHVVRGEDLADNTPRQILLQRALGLVTPQYLHTPLVLAADGHKLSKQNGARSLPLDQPLASLAAAGAALGIPEQCSDRVGDWLAGAVVAWAGIIAGFETRSY